MTTDYSQNIVRNTYLKILNREPDDTGLKHFTHLISTKQLTEDELILEMKKSEEYIRMKKAEENSRKDKYIFKGFYDILYEINSKSQIDFHISKNGIYDRFVGGVLNEDIRKNGIIFDVGANIGGLTLPFAKNYVPKGLVYAFEPDNEIINQLKKNVEINNIKNIKIIPKALQENELIEKIEFRQRREYDENGIVNNGISTIQENNGFNIKKYDVDTTTIDKFVRENKIERIDLLKIDVEGAEIRVLEGGSSSISKDLPIIIYEYSNVIDKMIDFPNTKKTFNFIKNKGYVQFKIINTERIEEIKEYDEGIPYADIICFHKTVNSKLINVR